MTDTPVHILHIEDDDTQAFLVRQYLEQPEWYPFRVHCVPTLAEAEAAIADQRPKLIILDMTLPDGEGLSSLRRIRAIVPDVPVVVLTGAMDEDLGVDAIESGAQDFLTKDELAPAMLVRAVRYAIRRQSLEDELRRLNADLEQRVRDRTAALEAANAELASFAYTVSHDLRAPLRQMGMFISMIQRRYGDGLPEKARTDLGRVPTLANKMSGMIEALYGLSQIGLGQNEDPIVVDLSALANEVATSLQEQDPQRKASFYVEPGLVARGDRTLLGNLLQNLMGNAWKFTAEQEETTIRVEAVETEHGPAFVVRDDGPGFDDTRAARIFEPFQRLPETRHMDGSGIGLATVQRIAARHGGKVWAEAAAGRGAAFFFTLQPVR